MMADFQCPESTHNDSIGPRFKAGLQSVLNGLGKPSSVTSSDKSLKKVVQPDDSLPNGHPHSADMTNHIDAKNSSETGDALLGEPDNEDEDLILNDGDDALLEGTDTTENSSSSLPAQPHDHNPTAVVRDKPDSDLGLASQEPEVLSDFFKPHGNEIEHERIDSSSSFQTHNQMSNPQSSSGDGNCDLTIDKSVEDKPAIGKPAVVNSLVDTQTENKLVGDSIIEKPMLDNPHITKPTLNNPTESSKESSQTFKAPLTNNITELASSVESNAEIMKPKIENSNMESSDLNSIDGKLERESTISPFENKEFNGHLMPQQANSVKPESEHLTPSASCLNEDPDCIAKSSGEDCKEDVSCKEPSSAAVLSPEGNRTADISEMTSPPPMETSTLDEDTTENDDSLLPNDNELCVASMESEDLHSVSSPIAVQETMNNLLGQTVAAVDGTMMTDNCGQPTLATISSSHRADGGGIHGSRSSAESIDEDDSLGDCLPSKRAKLSTDQSECRLNKLITHLSTAIGDQRETPSHDEMEDDLESFHLKKNGLASFYDAIIKTDVIKEGYHDDLAQRHQQLQIKNNMDCKKIQKILHEVKSVREKLKVMNVRPAQRSVSTQICTEKLQVSADQPGNRILKSTILSQKALAEQQQQKLAETKKRRELEAARIKNETQAKKQLEINSKLEAKRQMEEQARAAALRVKEQEKAKPQPPIRSSNTPPQMPKPPVNSTMRPAASPAANSSPKPTGKPASVIDLTSEDEPIKTTASVPPGANGRPKMLAEPKLNPFTPAAPAKPLHPAPLPACPLTGTSGHLLKPTAPRLELSSKEDGIVLQWNMPITKSHAKVVTYQIFGYKERPGPLTGTEWKKVGDLKALPLPMACTLTQFQTGHRYHFAVRAVDELGRTGPFGVPRSTKLG